MSQVRLSLICFLLFLCLGWAAQAGALHGLDAAGVGYLGVAAGSPWRPGLKFITHWGDRYGYIGAALLAMYLYKKRSRELLALLGILFTVLLTTEPLKKLFMVVRPGHLLNTPSYPSGHTLFATCLYWFCALLVARSSRRRWLMTVLLTCPLAVGWSRVALGYHWPSDVVGGWLLGSVVVLCFGF